MRWTLMVLVTVGALLAIAPAAHAATFTVTTFGDPVGAGCGVSGECESLRAAVAAAAQSPGPDTIVVPAFDIPARQVPADVLDALRDAHARGARLVSICGGAFALAAAGVLDGRRATTHWRLASTLASMYPAVDVDPDVLYGRVLTQCTELLHTLDDASAR